MVRECVVQKALTGIIPLVSFYTPWKQVFRGYRKIPEPWNLLMCCYCFLETRFKLMSWYGEHLLFFWLLDLQLGPAWNETDVTRFSPKCKSFQVNVPSLFPQNLSRFSGIFMGDKKEDIDLKMKKQPPEIFCKERSSKKIRNFRKAPVLSLFLILLKRDSNSSVFIWNLRDFYGHVFWETAVDDYFW